MRNRIEEIQTPEASGAIPPSRQSFHQAVQSFLNHCKLRNLSPATIDYYKFNLRAFEHFLERCGLDFDTLTPFDLKQRMMNDMIDQGYSSKTMRGRVCTCRVFFTFLWKDGLWETNIATELKLNKASSQGIFTFSEEQVAAILKQPNQDTFTGFRDYVMMLVLLETGVRVMELTNMCVSDIDFSERTICIPMGKGRKPRIVPIQTICSQALKRYIRERGELPIPNLWITLANQPLQRATIIRTIKYYCKKADIQGTRGSCHTFRHTMAKFYLMNGGDVFTLMYILGHTSIEMTRRYVDLFSKDIHIQHEKASPLEHVMASNHAEESEGDKT